MKTLTVTLRLIWISFGIITVHAFLNIYIKMNEIQQREEKQANQLNKWNSIY